MWWLALWIIVHQAVIGSLMVLDQVEQLSWDVVWARWIYPAFRLISDLKKLIVSCLPAQTWEDLWVCICLFWGCRLDHSVAQGSSTFWEAWRILTWWRRSVHFSWSFEKRKWLARSHKSSIWYIRCSIDIPYTGHPLWKCWYASIMIHDSFAWIFKVESPRAMVSGPQM